MDDRNLLGVIIDGGTTAVEKFRAVIASATEGKAQTPAAAGDRVLGVTQQRSNHDGAHVSIVTKGRTKCEAASAISYGDRVRAAGTTGKIEKALASLTTALTGNNNDMVFTAVSPAWRGLRGEDITIAYIDPGGTTATLAVTVWGAHINVSLGRASSAIDSTAAAVKAAIEAVTAAAAMVTIAHAASNDGSGLVTAMVATRLSGGAGDFGTALASAAANTEIIDVEVD